jgi:cell division protein FtsI/penicillin-binding protein 2
LHLEEMNTRIYPKGPITAHVLGITTGDTDSRGLAGIELNEDGRIAPRRAPSPMKALRLNLDIRVQEAAFAALHEAMSKHGVNAGAVIVSNKSGQILAMASAPAFDPADRSSIDSPNTENQALDNVFSAGGLLHPLARAAAISEGTDIASDWWLAGKLRDLGFDNNPRPGFYKSPYIDGLPVDNWGHLLEKGLAKPQARTTLSHLVSAYLSLIDGGVSSNLSIIEQGRMRWRNKVFDAETAAKALGELKRIPLNDTPSSNSIGGAHSSSVDSVYDPFPRAIDAFIAFAPIDSPRYVVAVMLQRNQARHITGSPAKSIAGQVADVVIGHEKQASP